MRDPVLVLVLARCPHHTARLAQLVLGTRRVLRIFEEVTPKEGLPRPGMGGQRGLMQGCARHCLLWWEGADGEALGVGGRLLVCALPTGADYGRSLQARCCGRVTAALAQGPAFWV